MLYAPTGERLAIMQGQAFAEARVYLPAGGVARYNSSGLTDYWHPDWLGTSRLESTPSRTVDVDAAFAPYGEMYAHSGSFDMTFTGSTYTDHASDLYDFPAREYHPTWGRWLRPDPAGLAAVDLSNPQSLNRYAYGLNRPTSVTDPLGLNCKVTDTCGGQNGGAGYNDARPFYPGGCPAFFPEECWPPNVSQETLAAEAAYIAYNCIGCVTFQGNLYGQDYDRTFPSSDAYFDWRSSLAALPINQIIAAYALGCQYATNPCGSNNSASVRYVGLTYNVTLNGNPLNQTAAAEAGYKDPLGYFHREPDGTPDPSYYLGFGNLLGIDAGHVVATSGGVEAHYDSWGPLNPFHWMEAVLSLFINTRNQAGAGTPYTCSVVGGCHP